VLTECCYLQDTGLIAVQKIEAIHSLHVLQEDPGHLLHHEGAFEVLVNSRTSQREIDKASIVSSASTELADDKDEFVMENEVVVGLLHCFGDCGRLVFGG
jgi:hypothetical protein